MDTHGLTLLVTGRFQPPCPGLDGFSAFLTADRTPSVGAAAVLQQQQVSHQAAAFRAALDSLMRKRMLGDGEEFFLDLRCLSS